MNIKSLVSLFLTLIILTTRVGYALNVHYCNDKIAKISLAYNSSNCGMESNFDSKLNTLDKLTKKSCCEDEIQLFQNHEPQKIDQEDFLKVTIIKNISLDIWISNSKITFFLSSILFNPLLPHKTCKLFLRIIHLYFMVNLSFQKKE